MFYSPCNSNDFANSKIKKSGICLYVHPFEIKFIETFFNRCSPVRIFHSNPTTLVHRQPNPLYLHQKLKILQEKQLPYKSS